jgi:hypothetical protein
MAKEKEIFWTEETTDTELLKNTIIYLIDYINDIRHDNLDYTKELKLDEFQERLKGLK